MEFSSYRKKDGLKDNNNWLTKKIVPNVERNQLNKGLKSPQSTTHIGKRGQHRGGSLFPLGMLPVRCKGVLIQHRHTWQLETFTYQMQVQDASCINDISTSFLSNCLNLSFLPHFSKSPVNPMKTRLYHKHRDTLWF